MLVNLGSEYENSYVYDTDTKLCSVDYNKSILDTLSRNFYKLRMIVGDKECVLPLVRFESGVYGCDLFIKTNLGAFQKLAHCLLFLRVIDTSTGRVVSSKSCGDFKWSWYSATDGGSLSKDLIKRTAVCNVPIPIEFALALLNDRDTVIDLLNHSEFQVDSEVINIGKLLMGSSICRWY